MRSRYEKGRATEGDPARAENGGEVPANACRGPPTPRFLTGFSGHLGLCERTGLVCPGVSDERAARACYELKPEELRDPARLLDFHTQAVAAGYVSSSEADRLKVFAAANHARVVWSENPARLFVRIVRSGLWSFLTEDDKEVARV